jgi:hypothetical protein
MSLQTDVRKRSTIPSSGIWLLSVLQLLKFYPKRPSCHYNIEMGFMMCGIRMTDLLRPIRIFSCARFHRNTAPVFRPHCQLSWCGVLRRHCHDDLAGVLFRFHPGMLDKRLYFTNLIPHNGRQCNHPSLISSNSVAILRTFFVKNESIRRNIKRYRTCSG